MCPTFHCNPTVLFTFNYYSKYIVNTDLQWFAVKSPLLHCILITLLIIPYLCHFDSTSFVLLIRPKYGILNRVIRVMCMQQISGLDSQRVMSSQVKCRRKYHLVLEPTYRISCSVMVRFAHSLQSFRKYFKTTTKLGAGY